MPRIIQTPGGAASNPGTPAEIDTRLDGLTLNRLTQAEYDALLVKDPDTLYIIPG